MPPELQEPEDHSALIPKTAPPFMPMTPSSPAIPAARDPDATPALQPDATPALHAARRGQSTREPSSAAQAHPLPPVQRTGSATPMTGDALPALRRRIHFPTMRIGRNSSLLIAGGLAILLAFGATLLLFGQHLQQEAIAHQQATATRRAVMAQQATVTSIAQTDTTSHTTATAETIVTATASAVSATQTMTAIFTKTYHAPIPGPCGGEGQWQPSGQYQCLAHTLHLISTNPGTFASVTFTTEAHVLPSYFNVAFDVVNLSLSNETTIGCFSLGDSAQVQDLPQVVICNNGGSLFYDVSPTNDSGTLAASSSFHVTMQVDSHSVRFGINGAWFFTTANPNITPHPPGIQILFGAAGNANAHSGSMDMKNFVFTPLSG